MATAEDLRAELAAIRQGIAREIQGYEQLDRETEEAKERQSLRRQVEAAREEASSASFKSFLKRRAREKYDRDEIGDVRTDGSAFARPPKNDKGAHLQLQNARTYTDIDSTVEHGELLWEIKGFSWLKSALEQESGAKEMHDSFAKSRYITVAGHRFNFVYHPEKGLIDFDESDGYEQNASLAIWHFEPTQYTGVAFRYKIFIQSSQRGFVQWGSAGDVCDMDDTEGMAFGPDVCRRPQVPAGIFNMSHKELLSSEWVVNDILTAKLQVAVRPRVLSERVLSESCHKDEIPLPPATIIKDLLSLFNDGSSSDVTFIVQGEPIKSHSSILCARSEVFRRMLNSGMRESTSKEIIIDDCEPRLFQAMLRFLYTDCFDHLEKMFRGRAGEYNPEVRESKADEGEAGDKSTRLQSLQSCLGLSHKYGLARLQSWCERELCSCISVEGVCPLLCQAHLYEAKWLEEACLKFIKANMEQVAKTSHCKAMARDWPDVMMKISFGSAELPRESAVGKRKRED